MKLKFITTGILVLSGMAVLAQETAPDTPKGKAIIQIFSNFHTGFGAENDDRGFELDRSYLGYEYNLGSGLSVKGVMDIGQSSDVDDYHHIAYIKNALVQWQTGNLTLTGGLIPTTQFNYQEKFWGYRYILKSFQDQYKFGSSADLGISASYKFANWITADAIVANGEGYKKVQKNNGLNYGLGMTLTPAKGFSVRLYGGLNEGSTSDEKETVNLAAFAGYKCETFSIGAEYNHMYNTSNKADADQNGYSVYTTVNLSERAALFARFDDLYSKDDWNESKEMSNATIGAQFKLGKYVKIAPNVRMSVPKADGAKETYRAYINCYFGF